MHIQKQPCAHSETAMSTGAGLMSMELGISIVEIGTARVTAL